MSEKKKKRKIALKIIISRFEGSWVDDGINGFGVCKYPDGSEYRGMWKDGFREGKLFLKKKKIYMRMISNKI